jgi:hypothetical protein
LLEASPLTSGCEARRQLSEILVVPPLTWLTALDAELFFLVVDVLDDGLRSAAANAFATATAASSGTCTSP